MHGHVSTAPRARRRTTLRLSRPERSPDVPPPMAARSGPFGAAEVLDVVDAGPSPAMRLFVLLAVLAGTLGIAAFVWAEQGSTALAATPATLR
jgi:hypothetical protein